MSSQRLYCGLGSNPPVRTSPLVIRLLDDETVVLLCTY